MNDNNYINIQGFMINKLGLKGNELILFAIIYGFSQDGQSEYYGSQRYIAKAMGISLVSANKLINKLLDKNLIEKTSESHYRCITKFNTTVKQSLTQTVKQSLTNNNNTNNNTNNNISNEVAMLISLFEKLDSKNKTYYGNKTQRAKAEFLLKEHGIEKIGKIIDIYLKCKGDKFLPSISSPYDMVEKWSKLSDFFLRKKSEQAEKVNAVIW